VLLLDDDALAPGVVGTRHRSAYSDECVVAAGGSIVLAFPWPDGMGHSPRFTTSTSAFVPSRSMVRCVVRTVPIVLVNATGGR
jgi:hypothetical protein